MRRLLSIVDSSPDNFEAPLGLELDNAYIKPFVEDGGCGWGNIGKEMISAML